VIKYSDLHKGGDMSKAIAKLFRDPGHAARAVADLLAKGFKSEEIGILVKAEVGLELAGSSPGWGR